MPLHYCTFSLFPLLDHTFLTVDDRSPTANVDWREHGKCNDLYSWLCKADHCCMGKDTQTRSHRATRICEELFGYWISTLRKEKTHNMPHSKGCVRRMRSADVFIPGHYTHSHLWNTKQGVQGALDLVPQVKYHHMLRYELTMTYYSFTSQNERSTHREICL